MSLLDEVAEKLAIMPASQKAALAKTLEPLRQKMRFVPLEGPQARAYNCKADILLYGGQAGGGKTALLIGLSSQEHQSSIIFRRESSQTDGLEKFGKDTIGETARYNGQDKEWNWPDGRSLKLAGMKEPGDWGKHAGRERDFFGFDEAGEFLRDQVASLLAWLRGPEGQRCRMVLASNPPRSTDGYWLTEWFAPWLDMHSANMAQPGELRWAVMLDSASGLTPNWVDGPADVEIDGEWHKPLSFTFIPAALDDNPYRNTPEYRARLNSLPEPLRSQLLFGDFSAGQIDEVNQAIPTDWVRQAQARWQPVRPPSIPMCAMGVDVAQGGTDQTVIAVRYDGWYPPLESYPGSQTPGGADVAGLVTSKRHDQARIIIDLGGGWGGDAMKHLAQNIGHESILGYMGVKDSNHRTRDNQLKFANVRTEAYWRFREALDPTQLEGSPIQLPPDKELLADLTAPTYETKSGKGGLVIHLEPKDKLTKRLGRSPDKGDAVVMAWFSGPKAVTDLREWQKQLPPKRFGQTPKVIMGRQAARRR